MQNAFVIQDSNDFYETIIEKCNNKSILNDYDIGYINNWTQTQITFHENRLTETKNKQIRFINYINTNVNIIFNTYNNRNPDVQCRICSSGPDINALHKKLKEHYDKWFNTNDTFSSDSDQKARSTRIYAWSDYFKAVYNLLKAIHKLSQQPKSIDPSPKHILSVMSQLYNNTYSTAQQNTTPFTTTLSECAKLWTIEEGITINILGQENLYNIYHDITQVPTVNLFMPSHRSPIPDLFMMAHLNLPHYILFGNPAMFKFPEFITTHFPSIPYSLKESVSSIPEFIAVGTIKDYTISPTDKLLKSLSTGISRNVINYAQGFVPSTGEILPISNAFVNKLLVPLLLNDYIVNIYPVAYETDSEFLFDKPDHTNITYTLKYGKPLFHEAIVALITCQLGSVKLIKENLEGLMTSSLQGDGPKCFDNYMLSFWFDNIVEHKELTYDELVERGNKRFGLF